ncbi:hypothetical protein C8R43DRAFT_964328 [Mycena crocata]|nr:hypothetical protein C8R43DRAFT_964328 [Mycena crocata]
MTSAPGLLWRFQPNLPEKQNFEDTETGGDASERVVQEVEMVGVQTDRLRFSPIQSLLDGRFRGCAADTDVDLVSEGVRLAGTWNLKEKNIESWDSELLSNSHTISININGCPIRKDWSSIHAPGAVTVFCGLMQASMWADESAHAPHRGCRSGIRSGVQVERGGQGVGDSDLHLQHSNGPKVTLQITRSSRREKYQASLKYRPGEKSDQGISMHPMQMRGRPYAPEWAVRNKYRYQSRGCGEDVEKQGMDCGGRKKSGKGKYTARRTSEPGPSQTGSALTVSKAGSGGKSEGAAQWIRRILTPPPPGEQGRGSMVIIAHTEEARAAEVFAGEAKFKPVRTNLIGEVDDRVWMDQIARESSAACTVQRDGRPGRQTSNLQSGLGRRDQDSHWNRAHIACLPAATNVDIGAKLDWVIVGLRAGVVSPFFLPTSTLALIAQLGQPPTSTS